MSRRMQTSSMTVQASMYPIQNSSMVQSALGLFDRGAWTCMLIPCHVCRISSSAIDRSVAWSEQCKAERRRHRGPVPTER
jgi:hypothetical protein